MKFSKRLENAILSKYRNISQFAEAAGFNDSVVRKYIKEDAVPTIKKVEELSKFLDVSPAWLAYGVDENNISEEKRLENLELVNAIYESVDAWLKKNKKKTTPEKKSKIVTYIYKQLMEKENYSSDMINEQVFSAMEIVA